MRKVFTIDPIFFTSILCLQSGIFAGGSQPADAIVRIGATARLAPLRLSVAVSDAALFSGDVGGR